jgi:hypothetical protein
VIVAMDPVAQPEPRGAAVARKRDRAHDLADLAAPAEQVALRAIHARTCAGSEWNWNGPGLTSALSVQSTGDSEATMSSRFTRQGVPSMISLHPSQRVATLSFTIVRISTPMISIASDGSRPPAGARAWCPQGDSNP